MLLGGEAVHLGLANIRGQPPTAGLGEGPLGRRHLLLGRVHGSLAGHQGFLGGLQAGLHLVELLLGNGSASHQAGEPIAIGLGQIQGGLGLLPLGPGLGQLGLGRRHRRGRLTDLPLAIPLGLLQGETGLLHLAGQHRHLELGLVHLLLSRHHRRLGGLQLGLHLGILQLRHHLARLDPVPLVDRHLHHPPPHLSGQIGFMAFNPTTEGDVSASRAVVPVVAANPQGDR